MSRIQGLGPDQPIVENEDGGRQAYSPYRFDLLDGYAVSVVARVLAEGAEKHGDSNWRYLAPEDHLNHLLGHLFAWIDGDTSEDHLAHAACRMMMLVAASRGVRGHER